MVCILKKLILQGEAMISSEFEDCFKSLLSDSRKYRGSLPSKMECKGFIDDVLGLAPADDLVEK